VEFYQGLWGGPGSQIRLDKRPGVDLYGVAFRAMIKPVFSNTISGSLFPSGDEDDE